MNKWWLTPCLSSMCQAEAVRNQCRCGWFHGVWPESDWAHARSKQQTIELLISLPHQLTQCHSWYWYFYLFFLSSSSSRTTLKVITSFTCFEMMSEWLLRTCCPCRQSVSCAVPIISHHQLHWASFSISLSGFSKSELHTWISSL